MKAIKLLIGVFLIAIGMTACEDDNIRAVLKNEVAPNTLQTPANNAFVLTMEEKDAIMSTFSWTAPDFGYPAGINYTLELDLAGNDFENAEELAITGETSAAINVGEINDILLGLGLSPEEAAEIDLRVVSSIGSQAEPVYSNTVTIAVTPYATEFPPIWGMGAALKGWGPWPDNAVEWQSNAFKKYETISYFTSGEAFRFFAQQDWGPESYNYPYFTTVSPIFENANDGDSNLKVAGASGWYKVGVDLNAKTVTAEEVEEPVLYMMGAALNGWGPWPDNAVKMNYVKPGVFEVEADFKVANEAFRFFAQPDWSPTSYNYPFFETVDSNFENANDGDSNFRFIGSPGVLKVTVDLTAKTITVGDTPDPVIYMMGAALNGWGPWPDAAVTMDYIGPDTFQATATFTNGEAFRFFAQADWGPTSYNYPYFTSVDADFENANDGDSNLRYIGETGSRTITVDLVNKTVTLQ